LPTLIKGMSQKNFEESLVLLTKKIEGLENQIKDLQSQQLETGQNIVTLIQHAETMNNVTDASGLLAEHVTDLENRLNLVIDWMKEEIRQRGLN
jgi:hypothetical protein